VLRANVDRPEQGCEKQYGIIAVDLWRVGTGAYERYFETSALDLHFLVHDVECVVETTLCDCARSLRQTDVVKLMFQVAKSRGFSRSVISSFGMEISEIG
jgi:hypothetical protein